MQSDDMEISNIVCSINTLEINDKPFSTIQIDRTVFVVIAKTCSTIQT